jgi:hypothetical protein
LRTKGLSIVLNIFKYIKTRNAHQSVRWASGTAITRGASRIRLLYIEKEPKKADW